jgi:Yip1 domain
MSAPSAPSIPEMFNQSIQVITKPSVVQFEELENKGTMREAIIYVAIGAAISGLFGLGNGVSGLLANVISALVGFFVFTYVVHAFGKSQGGTGTLDQVAYTFSLFWVPLNIAFALLSLVLIITLIGILLLPLVGILAIAANVYFAYLAVQSSMNMTDTGKVWLTLVVAFVATLVVTFVITGIFGTR